MYICDRCNEIFGVAPCTCLAYVITCEALHVTHWDVWARSPARAAASFLDAYLQDDPDAAVVSARYEVTVTPEDEPRVPLRYVVEGEIQRHYTARMLHGPVPEGEERADG